MGLLEYSLIFVGMVALKFFFNAAKLKCAKRLRDRYFSSLTENGPQFSEYIPQMRKLIFDAGLGNASIAVCEPIGYKRIASFNARVADNLDNRRADVVTAAVSLLDQTVGVFRMRMMESVSPRFWIEFVLFLPRNTVQYLGGKKDGFTAKMLQLLYWIATPFLIAFRTDIYEYVIRILRKA